MPDVISSLIRSLMMVICALLIFVTPSVAFAADDFRLSAPASLVDTGFLTYVLPRFSLKTGVRVELVAEGDTAEVMLMPESGWTK